ncbi:NRDE family protein [Roseiconus lacunae]|uniref:NRDE family protein n=1 Tax=Roseiconus lacunae TaxID=2605694 RepID=A0ABT7PC74_9BACT|nr:NRDE family protein [Roseiconus lacunae]MCD0463089.1 NRDE family protein [Roseiconus lacunae]MDM4013861.1 NRDE family protein [Roseiconus lacunae]WRQ53167.1 NRDE family protein [Stieleria sp. HD01]
MCLLAVQYQLVPESPILVAANREEYFDRPSLTPSIQSGKPRVLCGIDQKAGGTWLGVNQNGLFVGVCNRATAMPLFGQRSRGSLAMDLLRCTTASRALEKALGELAETQYEGCNLVIADAKSGYAIYSDQRQEVVDLQPGLNIIGNHNLNDPDDERVCMARRLLTLQTLDSPVKFLAVASRVFARAPVGPGRPSMVVRNKDYGTVSSSLIALGVKPRDAIYQYSNGAPDQTKYEDCSPMLRDILSRGLREARTKAKMGA